MLLFFTLFIYCFVLFYLQPWSVEGASSKNISKFLPILIFERFYSTQIYCKTTSTLFLTRIYIYPFCTIIHPTEAFDSPNVPLYWHSLLPVAVLTLTRFLYGYVFRLEIVNSGSFLTLSQILCSNITPYPGQSGFNIPLCTFVNKLKWSIILIALIIFFIILMLVLL